MLEHYEPCPFCGGKAYHEDLIMGVWVKCHGHRDQTGYHLKCSVVLGPYDSKHEAVTKWNKRYAEKPVGRPHIKRDYSK